LRINNPSNFEINTLIIYAIRGITERIRGFTTTSFFIEIAPMAYVDK